MRCSQELFSFSFFCPELTLLFLIESMHYDDKLSMVICVLNALRHEHMEDEIESERKMAE